LNRGYNFQLPRNVSGHGVRQRRTSEHFSAAKFLAGEFCVTENYIPESIKVQFMIQVIPTIIAKDFQELQEKVKKVEPYVDWVQLDVMDGQFVLIILLGIIQQN
jgi:hypothetical protein